MGALTSKIVTPKFYVKDPNPSDDRSIDEVHLDCNPKEDTLEAMGCDTSSDLDDNTTNEYQCSRSNSVMSVHTPQISLLLDRSRRRDQDEVLCKICLMDYSPTLMVKLEDCGCTFCKECIQQYITFKVMEGAYDISCPDLDCLKQGILNQHQMERLTSKDLMDKHRTFRLNTEVSIDAGRTWCPSAGCDTICHIGAGAKSAGVPVCCPTCTKEFCSLCSATWHPGITCAENGALLVKRGGADIEPMVFDSCDGNIKRCPGCNVPIERAGGCALMICKSCKHAFCWYCLTSLDDVQGGILLRHYDSGACKGRLGHSWASVQLFRALMIGIFVGIVILLLVASLLLLVASLLLLVMDFFKKKEKRPEEAAAGNSLVPIIGISYRIRYFLKICSDLYR